MSEQMNDQMWAVEDVAAFLKVKPTTVHSYRRKGGTFPEPDGYLGVTPWWRPGRIAEWRDQRPSAEWGGGRKKTYKWQEMPGQPQ